MTRDDLTEKLLDIKREKGWTWKYICGEIGGMSPILVTGGDPRPDETDQAAGRRRRQAVRALARASRRCSTKCRCAAPARRCRRPIR